MRYQCTHIRQTRYNAMQPTYAPSKIIYDIYIYKYIIIIGAVVYFICYMRNQIFCFSCITADYYYIHMLRFSALGRGPRPEPPVLRPGTGPRAWGPGPKPGPGLGPRATF